MSFIYSKEKNSEKKISIHTYTVESKYHIESFTLFGSNNHLCWFILDEVFQPLEDTKKNMYVINRNINNNAYFRYFKLEVQIESVPNDKELELEFDETDFNENIPPPIKTSNPSIEFDSSNQNIKKLVGLLETLMSNNFHSYITVHQSDYLDNNNSSNQNYSIFSNYIHPKPDLNNLDPRPKGKYEFIFHSFHLRINRIFFKIKRNDFLIDYLNSKGKWCKLIHTSSDANMYVISSDIYGIRFDTNILRLIDFDFFGQIQFFEDSNIIPSSFSAFPFWGSNLNGILNGIKNFTSTDPTKSGLFEAVGQLDKRDNSEKSFLRGMNSIFDEYDDPNASITFKFGFKIKLSSYIIHVPQRDQRDRNRNPHKWKLEGSNDEKNWFLLDEVEDNIFDTETEAVVYRTKNTSDYFSFFKITKFDDIILNNEIRFNQLILYDIEFFGIISPFYSSPSFFWRLPIVRNYDNDKPYINFFENTSVQPIIPIDLCNGILGCFNFYGGEANQRANHYKFDFFNVSLVALAIIHLPKDLTITLLTNENKTYHVDFKNSININDDVTFIKLEEIVYDITEISISRTCDGIEFFGLVSDDLFTNYIIMPSQKANFPFNFDFHSDILKTLIFSEFHNYRDTSNLIPSFFKVEATEKMKIKSPPSQLIESKNDENFAFFDFIDSSVSLNFLAISCRGLQSLKLEGSNDRVHYEDVLEFTRVHRNFTLNNFVIQSKNRKYFRFFKLYRSENKTEIEFVNFFGELKLIRPKMRNPYKLKTFQNFFIPAGLDCQNGILNALKKSPIIKKKEGDVYLIDFFEISIVVKFVSLVSFNLSQKNEIKIDGYNDRKEKIFSLNYETANQDQIIDDDAILQNNSEEAVTSIEIKTNWQNFSFDKIELFGQIIISRPNPIRKKPPNFDYFLNPFNGILNSGCVKYRKSSHFHYTEIEFDSIVFCKDVFIQFNENVTDDFFIEASNSSASWQNLDLSADITSPTEARFKINESGGFSIFHFCSKSNLTIKKIELFGKVEEKDENLSLQAARYKIEEPIKILSNKVTKILYDKNRRFCGLFYSIQHNFDDLKTAFSTKGTTGNESSEISLFDHYSNDNISFTSTHNNVIYIHFRFAHIKLSDYAIYFGADLLLQKNINKWKLEGSNDAKNWELIEEVETESNLLVSNLGKSKGNINSYSHFRFILENPCVLRKIEFYGDYIPAPVSNDLVIIKNHPVFLKKNPFSGILNSMCRFTNIFEKQLVKTSPPNLSKIIINNGGKNNEEVTIDQHASINFGSSKLKLNYYSLKTTMKNWSIKVKSNKSDDWIEIHQRKDNNGCCIFKVDNCPSFSKIRIENNDEKPQKLKKIEFFGKISDKKLTKTYRYDVMNGLLSLLMYQFPNSVIDREITVKSSDYRYTNPLQLFERNRINRIFCFLPSKTEKKEESSVAFVTLEFWSFAIQIEKYSLLLFKNKKVKNLKIEGATSLPALDQSSEIKWEEIDFLNEKNLNCNDTLLRDSKSSHFFHFIRLSSTDEFCFENIEFFGDFKQEKIEYIDDHVFTAAIPEESFEVDALAKFPPIPVNSNEKNSEKFSKSGFFHSKDVKINGFIEISTTESDVNSKPLLSIFRLLNPNEYFTLNSPSRSITINFLTTSFQLTHFYIECLTDNVKVSVFADGTNVYNGPLMKVRQTNEFIFNKDLKKMPFIVPATKYEFKFYSSGIIKLQYIEFFGNLMQKNDAPDRLLSTGHNHIDLSFTETVGLKKFTNKTFSLMKELKRFDIFRDGVINFILKNSINSILSIYERYPTIEKYPVTVNTDPPFELAFGNSPQVTFDFGFSSLLLEKYSIETGMRHWLMEGSQNHGKSWFVIDIQQKSEVNSTNLFALKKLMVPVSLIRITNLDSLFDGFYGSDNESINSSGIKKIEFFGDLIVSLPTQIDEKVTAENDRDTFYSILDDSENEVDDEDQKNSMPQENLIFFPQKSLPVPKTPTKSKRDSSPRGSKNKNKSPKSESNSEVKSEAKSEADLEINEYEYEYEYYYEYEAPEELELSSSNDQSSTSELIDDNIFNITNLTTSELLSFLAMIRSRINSSDDFTDDISLSNTYSGSDSDPETDG